MKSSKVCAIIGNIVDYDGLGKLVEHRPLATLPFGGKYRLIDFQLSAVANAGIRNVYAVFKHSEFRSVFDHIGSGKEWGLDTLLNRYFLGFYEDVESAKTRGEDYYGAMIDYLQKSKSDQTVFMSSNMLANVDLKQVLQVHRNHGKNMTVVYKKVDAARLSSSNPVLEIDENNEVIQSHYFADCEPSEDRLNMSMGVFVIETKWLIEHLREAYQTNLPPSLQFWLAEKVKDEKTTAYEFTGFVSNIFDVKSYYKANMEMLDPATFNTLFFSNNKVYTKVKNEAPTYFSKDSIVKKSQFASGSVIKGNVEGSVVSRNVQIGEGSVVKNSIVMPATTLESGAHVECAILDKNVVVKSTAKIIGSPDAPIVIKKGSVVE